MVIPYALQCLAFKRAVSENIVPSALLDSWKAGNTAYAVRAFWNYVVLVDPAFERQMLKSIPDNLVMKLPQGRNIKDISDERIGHYIAIRPAGPLRGKSGNWGWLFKCDCGREKILDPYEVRRQTYKSCGCTWPQNLKKLQALLNLLEQPA